MNWYVANIAIKEYSVFNSTLIDTLSTEFNTMITASQIRMARAALKIGVRDLAALAKVAPMTISRLENGHSGGLVDTLKKVQSALEEAGVLFVPENGEGPGVRLKKGKQDV